MTTTTRIAAIAALLLASSAAADPAKTPGSKPGPVAPTPPTAPTAPTAPAVPGMTPIGGVKGETVPNDMAAKKALPKPAKPDKDMAAVLDEMAALGGRPIDTLTPAEARKQPTPADAVKSLVEKKTGKPLAPQPVAKVDDTSIPVAGGGSVPARIYTPKGKGPFPVIVYFHGGGWVIANLDAYDATPRALANATGAIVVAASYRQAPEHRFPAAHDDAFAAYQWVLANAAGFGGDATRVAVAGESAGGNLAINTAIRARDAGTTAPRHMLLVYPVAGKDMTTPSYLVNAQASPLGAAAMTWFVKHVFGTSEQVSDPRIDLVSRTDLAGLPPATVITTEIDPLRSEGQDLAAKLAAAGVKVDAADYTGVSHEFFGMAPVVAKAKQAQARAAKNLKAAFKARPARK
jgi:acetyl esterase